MNSAKDAVNNQAKTTHKLLQDIVNQGGGSTSDTTAANQVLQIAQETITATAVTAINNKITFGDANTLGEMQCVGIYAERSGGAWAQLQTDMASNLKTTNLNITKGNDATLVSAQQVGSYAMNESTGIFQPLSAHHSNKSLKTTDANITKGSDATLVSAQQVLSYGIDAAGVLRPIKVGDTGRLIVEVDGIRSSGKQLAWTIGSNVESTSTVIDMGTHTRIAFYGDTDNTTNTLFRFEYSQDGTTWFQGSEDNAKVVIVAANGNFYDEEIVTPPQVRLWRKNTTVATENINLYWTQL